MGCAIHRRAEGGLSAGVGLLMTFRSNLMEMQASGGNGNFTGVFICAQRGNLLRLLTDNAIMQSKMWFMQPKCAVSSCVSG